jgi:sn-glycerol 3-phosphate transport system permease protein
MTEYSNARRALPHLFLILACAIIVFPIWLVFVASTRTSPEIMSAPMPLLPGSHFFENYGRAVLEGAKNLGASAFTMMKNSLVMALGISTGKIVISLLAAFAIVFFDFKLRSFCFWSIFVTLMLPVEVRIMPTYKVISDLGMLNTYAGLIMPMIVSATAVFCSGSSSCPSPGKSRRRPRSTARIPCSSSSASWRP